MHFVCRLLIGTAILGGGTFDTATADEHLLLYFHQRPPYSWLDDSSNVVGVVAEPVEAAMRAAGVAFTWAALPSARQMEMVKRDEALACGLGWFKRPERLEFARFSAPVYRDRRMVIIARNTDARFIGAPSIDTLFRDGALTLLTKVGYSYGAAMDAKIAALDPPREVTSTDNRHMLDMIALNRADYMLMAAEEADHLLRGDSDIAAALASYQFEGAPEGEARYLMCSNMVPQALLDRFNAALAAP